MLIDKIIDSIENSTVNWREGAKGNRSIVINQKVLDAFGKQNLLQQAKELEQQGLIRCEWIVNKSDISLIWYSLSDLRDIYQCAGRIPKSDRIREMKEAVEEQMKRIGKQWIRDYYNHVLKDLESGKELKEFNAENRKLNFDCFYGIDRLDSSVYKRVFSKQYLGDSKIFEQKMQNYIATAARKYYDVIDDNMTTSEILAQILIDNYADELSLKGDLIIRIDDHLTDLSFYPYGTVLNSETLKRVSIASKQNIKKIVTVENKANFMTYPYEKETLVLFSHGYFSPGERRILVELSQILSVTDVKFYHTGDLDYGGIRIFEFIRNQIFPKLKPLHMDEKTWEKYSKYGYPLEQSKLDKLNAMLNAGKIHDTDLQNLAELIIQTGTGIEQESFLFREESIVAE